MERITKDRLQKRLDLLNGVLGVPLKPFYFEDGKYRVNKETYCLGWAYGGVRLERAGGSVDVSPRGTKRDVWNYIGAMLDGIDAAREHGK